MIRLLKIDLLKLTNYRTFWILVILYFVTMGLITSSGMEFLKWVVSKGADFDDLDILRVPLYHFPDIWQNLTYVSLFFKLVLAIIVIISITNEFSYKTVRQNIIDGFDRMDFIISKVLTIFVLSLASTLFVFLIGLITGSIYSPETEMRFMFRTIEFIPGYFLDVFSYLLMVMLFSMVIKRAGLAIGLTLIYPALEYAFTANLPDSLDVVSDYLPLHAINNLVRVPFQRYAFMEIQDYVAWADVGVVIIYCFLFIYLSYLTLVKKDLN
jgi:ABC-2 type transport system permease protein